MSQNPCNNPNISTTLRNSTLSNHEEQCQQVRGRSRNHQFRLFSTSDAYGITDDTTTSTPTALNIVVPSHITSKTSIVSKSSLPSQILDPSNQTHNLHLSKMNSWMEQPHSTSSSSAKKCQVKPERVEKLNFADSKNKSPPKKSPQHDVKHLKQRPFQNQTEPEICGDAAKLNGQLNEIFVRRLEEIENVARGDTDIKLVTYQEWVDMLMQINEVIIANMVDLESEVAEKLECMKRKINSSCSQTSNIEQKYRLDICSLMQLIKNAYHHDNWDTQGLDFHTVNLTEIFGSRETAESFDADQDSRNRARRRSIF
ncbi:uncharacterized protein [Eurosta solidaginis]|uniref:uncharacterized protein isoform X2 n=1 Tax=Eurosta solidaginis TaxID=178769 RepID=UPI003530CC7F